MISHHCLILVVSVALSVAVIGFKSIVIIIYIDGTDCSWIILFWRQRCRWFASHLAAFLLSNIAEQKSRPSPSKSGMGGRYFIDYQLYYIMRCFGVGEQQTFQNFPPTKLNAPIAELPLSSKSCTRGILMGFHGNNTKLSLYHIRCDITTICCDITTMDVISQRVVISQRWCEIPDLGIHIQKGGHTKHAR